MHNRTPCRPDHMTKRPTPSQPPPRPRTRLLFSFSTLPRRRRRRRRRRRSHPSRKGARDGRPRAERQGSSSCVTYPHRYHAKTARLSQSKCRSIYGLPYRPLMAPLLMRRRTLPTGRYNGGYGGVKPKSSLCSHTHTHVHPRRGTWLRLCDGDSECERRVTLACRVPIMALIRGGPEGLADAHQHTRGGGDHASSRSANQTEENKGRGECGR